VFADGSVYPSLDLIKKFSLEYGDKPEKDAEPIGNGFDIIPSDEFGNYLKVEANCIWISPVPRSASKIDLFGTVGYDATTGKPAMSVAEQGTMTFGKTTLLPLIERMYGVKAGEDKVFNNGQRFIDLQLHGLDEENNPFILPPGKTVAFLPKAKQRGEEKGTATVIKRDNPEFYCLYPVPTSMPVVVEKNAELTVKAQAVEA
jgi:hypothetical protein